MFTGRVNDAYMRESHMCVCMCDANSLATTTLSSWAIRENRLTTITTSFAPTHFYLLNHIARWRKHGSAKLRCLHADRPSPNPPKPPQYLAKSKANSPNNLGITQTHHMCSIQPRPNPHFPCATTKQEDRREMLVVITMTYILNRTRPKMPHQHNFIWFVYISKAFVFRWLFG